jgi:hypothetical protein
VQEVNGLAGVRSGGGVTWIQLADEPTAIEAPNGTTIIEEAGYS